MLKNNPYNKAYLNIINESAYVEKCRQIAKEIGGEYIVDINTIDCMGNRIHFKDNWLDENGTFNFKLINTSNDWSFMFCDCKSLKHLPDSFTIPEGVTNCKYMFALCTSLTDLPDNFTIPKGVTDCGYMFIGCESLTDLPDSFNIPIDCNCEYMFSECDNLAIQDPEAYQQWEL